MRKKSRSIVPPCFFSRCTFSCGWLWGPSELHPGTCFIPPNATLFHVRGKRTEVVFFFTQLVGTAPRSVCSCSQPPALAPAHFPAFLGQKEDKKEREESLPRSSASVCSLSNYRPFHSSPLVLLSLFPPDINRVANAALDLVASSHLCGCAGLVQGQTTAGCYRKGCCPPVRNLGSFPPLLPSWHE